MNTVNTNRPASVLAFVGPNRVKEKTEQPSGDAVTFSHPLSADFDTNRARLEAAASAYKTKGLEFEIPESGMHETPSNQDLNQTEFEANMVADLGEHTRIQNQQDVSKLEGRLPTVPELQEEFQKLAHDQAIPFEYIKDGCYARAHMMCDTMHDDNINCAKMFVMLENPMGKDRLTASNKFMNAKWWYHVAPLSFAQNPETKAVEAFIMDPSMADHPLKPTEWVRQMWDGKTNIKIDVTRAPQYGPAEAGGVNETFEESIPDAHETAAHYSAELKEIKEDYYAHHPDEKPFALRRAA